MALARLQFNSAFRVGAAGAGPKSERAEPNTAFTAYLQETTLPEGQARSGRSFSDQAAQSDPRDHVGQTEARSGAGSPDQHSNSVKKTPVSAAASSFAAARGFPDQTSKTAAEILQTESGSPSSPGPEASTPVQSLMRPQRSFSFSELGIFGLHGAEADEAAPAASSRAPENIDAPATPDQDGTASPTETADPNDIATAITRERPSSAPIADRLQTLTANSQALDDSSTPVVAGYAQSLTDSDAGGAEPMTRGIAKPIVQEAQAANRINVAVSGPDEALAVIARGPGEATVDPLQIRQLFESTAAEFGMKIDELYTNGSSSQPSGRSTRGSHTR